MEHQSCRALERDVAQIRQVFDPKSALGRRYALLVRARTGRFSAALRRLIGAPALTVHRASAHDTCRPLRSLMTTPPRQSQEPTEADLDLVRAVARRIHRKLNLRVEFDDVVQLGMLGWVEARDRWDRESGTEFSSFAYYRVRGAILDGLRTLTGVSRTQIGLARRAFQASSFQESHGEAQRSAEESRFISESVNTVVFVAEFAALCDSMSVNDLNPDAEHGASPDARLERMDGLGQLKDVLNRLPEDERHILVSHYLKDQSLAEIAREMGVSRSWVCRLHARAILHARELAEPKDPKKRPQHATSG